MADLRSSKAADTTPRLVLPHLPSQVTHGESPSRRRDVCAEHLVVCAASGCEWVCGYGSGRGLPRLSESCFLHSARNDRIPGAGVSVVGARIPCMATVFGDSTTHPVAAAVAAAEADLDQVAGVGFWSMTPTEAAETLAALHRLGARTAALELGTPAPSAETLDVGPAAGATDTASWWAHTTRQTKRTAHHRMELAQALDRDHEPVRDAMAARACFGGAGGGDREGCREAAGRAPW